MIPTVRIAALISTLSLIIVGGTVFFRLAEGWTWLDSLFFAVVTLATVGYGDLVPQTAVGKIGTIVFIFMGLGVFATTIQQFTAHSIRTRAERAQAEETDVSSEQSNDPPPR